MNLVAIKNKEHFGLRVVSTVTSVMMYGLMLSYIIFSAIKEMQDNTMFGVMFILLALLCGFSAGVEMNLTWKKLKRKDGTEEPLKKSVLIMLIITNVVMAILGVLCWVAVIGGIK